MIIIPEVVHDRVDGAVDCNTHNLSKVPNIPVHIPTVKYISNILVHNVYNVYIQCIQCIYTMQCMYFTGGACILYIHQL